MSVQRDPYCIDLFEAWNDVPSGYGFNICGKNIHFRAIDSIFPVCPVAVVIIYLPSPPLDLSTFTLSLVPFICTLKILPAWFMTRQSCGR